MPSEQEQLTAAIAALESMRLDIGVSSPVKDKFLLHELNTYSALVLFEHKAPQVVKVF